VGEHPNAWLNGKSEKLNFAAHLIGTGHVFEKNIGVALLNEREESKILILKIRRNRNHDYQLLNDVIYTTNKIESIVHVCVRSENGHWPKKTTTIRSGKGNSPKAEISCYGCFRKKRIMANAKQP